MMENFQNFQTAHLNQCMVRFGHLLPIIAILACTAISGTILVQQQIVFELNLVPEFHPFTTPANTTTALVATTTVLVAPTETSNTTGTAIIVTSTSTSAPTTTTSATTTTTTATTSTIAPLSFRKMEAQSADSLLLHRQRDLSVDPPPILRQRAV